MIIICLIDDGFVTNVMYAYNIINYLDRFDPRYPDSHSIRNCNYLEVSHQPSSSPDLKFPPIYPITVCHS